MSCWSFDIHQRTQFPAQLRPEGRIPDMKNGLSLTSTKHSTLVFKHTSFITHTSQLLAEGRGLCWSGLFTVRSSLKPEEGADCLWYCLQTGGAGPPRMLPCCVSRNPKERAGRDWKTERMLSIVGNRERGIRGSNTEAKNSSAPAPHL